MQPKPYTVAAELQSRLETLLPAATARAIASYEQFIANSDSATNDAKDFAAHHAACKAALLHLDTLAKLAKWADSHCMDTTSKSQVRPYHEGELQLLLKRARAELLALDEDGCGL